MTTDLGLVRQTLESQLREAAHSHASRESIRIHQVADPVDMTQQAAEREMAVANLDRGSVLVRRVRSAIDRLDDGSYGICLECEEEIAPKRLKALPWAERCIGCQEKADSAANRKENLRAADSYTEAA
jgi:DnaK suppressor protein